MQKDFPPLFRGIIREALTQSVWMALSGERRWGALSQQSQVLYGNPKLVTVTLLSSGKEVGGWTGGEIVAKLGWKPWAPSDESSQIFLPVSFLLLGAGFA